MVRLRPITSTQVASETRAGVLMFQSDDSSVHLYDGSKLYDIIYSVNGRTSINVEPKIAPTYALDVYSPDVNYLRISDGVSEFKIVKNGTETDFLCLPIHTSGLRLDTPLASTSGGTGHSTYNEYDILVAGTNNTLTKLSKPTVYGQMLCVYPDGVRYGRMVFDQYMDVSDPHVSSDTYTFSHIKAFTDVGFMDLTNVSTNVYTDLIKSSTLGSIVVDPTSSDLSMSEANWAIGDVLTVGPQTRKVIDVTTGVITVDTPFTFVNKWSLVGSASMSTLAFKFGTKSLKCTTLSDYATMVNPTITTPATWTLEMFVNISTTASNQNIFNSSVNAFSILLTYVRTGNKIGLSLGQGTTFNIANAVASTTAITVPSWAHVAVCFTGTSYTWFINGTAQTAIASSLGITSTAFQNVRFGSGTALLNGYIDEVRLSDVVRYTSAFTPTTTAFTTDVDTLILNHFEQTTITLSDDISSTAYPYSRGGIYSGCSRYTYVSDGFVYFSTRKSINTLVDFPSSTSGIAQLSLVIPVSPSNIPYTIAKIGRVSALIPRVTVVNALSNTTNTTTTLNHIIPDDAGIARLLLLHTHVGTTSCSVVVNDDSYLQSAIAGTTSLTIDVPTPNISFTSRLSNAASTTSYTIILIGWFAHEE